MATHYFNDSCSDFVTMDYDLIGAKLLVSVPDLPLLHECKETNTFIINHPDQTTDEERYYEIRNDLIAIDGMPVQYGQFAFLVYWGQGEFYTWASSDNCSTGKVCKALKSFGYTASVTSPVIYTVSDQDTFKLKLQFGR